MIIYILVIRQQFDCQYFSNKYVFQKYTFFEPRPKPGPQSNTDSYHFGNMEARQ